MTRESDLGKTAWLEQWYFRQCNGDWEHTHGIIIETLDNPGWAVQGVSRPSRIRRIA
jgi:hypothetical protein